MFPKTSQPEETVKATTPETTAPAAMEELPTEAETTAPTEKGYHEVQPGEDISGTVVDVKWSPEYVQMGGAYLGGITYRVPFENVPANGQMESVAGHFRPEGSKIVGVVIMPES